MKELLNKQQVRFLVAGSGNTLLDFLVLNALTLAVGLPLLVANTISVALGITISYLLQHHFVFRYPSKVSWRKYGEFVLFTGFSSLVLQNLIIWGFESLFDTEFGNSLLLLPDADGRHVLGVNIAKAVAVLVGLVWNFVFYKLLVFRMPASAATIVVDPVDDAPVELDLERDRGRD